MKSTTNPTFITKYRPYYIRDFCLTDKFVSVLKTFIDLDQLNLLLIGDSNSGKSTLINAIIREYYGLDKTSAFPEHNIMFVNNLKEQGIQYFRNDMKTFCQSRCSIYGKKKLVLVDDIDNINEQSQQVFRNYIDKYKKNVNFISVCTNVQKVIESIQSRLHIIQIPRPSKEQFCEVMENVVRSEKINIDEESKTYLITVSNSSIRTLLNYLEKMFIYNQPITIDLCKKLCSNISYQQFELYIGTLKQGDLNGAIAILYEIYDFGYSVIDILDFLFTFVKLTPLIGEEMKYQVIIMLCKYITIFHNVHENCVELALFTNDFYQLFVAK
jgi:DNA polymerase III delta prime subunit